MVNISTIIYNFWLVVWNIFIIQNISYVILPIDFHIFQRGGYTTNQIYLPRNVMSKKKYVVTKR